MSRLRVLPHLHAADYPRHTLHADDRLWVEKNCYVDVIIEMLHALKVEPLAAMGFCAAVDFEGDNFTFFKPPHAELRALFGVDIQELNVWRPLIEHASEHLAAGKFISTEANAFWLPDTAGTDYRRNHVKTTIIIAEIDVDARVLGYFHNAAYYELSGEDFERLFRIGVPQDPSFLPLFAELVRIDGLVHRPPSMLAQMAVTALTRHVARRPATNPINRFGDRFSTDLSDLQARGLAYYHAWAFATTRQLGAAMELLAAHLQWLRALGHGPDLTGPAADFASVSETAKAFILKAARAVNSKRPLDATGTFNDMAISWERGMSLLAERLGADTETSP